ncbi:hypothetical protein [Qipengyuania nanhaisediminis]|uniref:hypothetical protein n=1 Tax=Qipengyuania nanhaisediminis TaxID=604088 RepID=UPI0038B33168
MNSNVTFSELCEQTFAEISGHSRAVIVFFALMVPVAALGEWAQPSNSAGFDIGFMIDDELAAQGLSAVLAVVAAAIMSTVLTFYLYAAMVRRTHAPGFHRFWPWLGIYILSWLGIALGFIALIVPGLILLTRWSAVLPIVIEGRVPAMDAYGESWRAVRGNSLTVFAVGFVLLVGLLVISGIIGALAIASAGAMTIAVPLISGMIDALGTIVFVAFSVAIYRLMAANTEDVAQVFS